jgi:hypothetical protein
MANITNTGFHDKLELYRIDKHGRWDLEVETVKKPSVFQKLKCRVGLGNMADDALTNYAINDLAAYLSTKYTYVSVGTDATLGTDYTLNELVAPVMTRVAATKSFMNTYGTDVLLPDTAVYTSIMTSSGDYTLRESGLHTTITGGYMGARQTYYNWVVANGETFGMIWKIINSRG